MTKPSAWSSMLSQLEQPARRNHPAHPNLERKFSDLVKTCARFSREIAHEAGWNGNPILSTDSVVPNLKIARTVFGKWCLEIMALLYIHHSAGFQEMRQAISTISSRVLSGKLTRMQDYGLVRRDVIPTHPPRVVYSLTERGLTVAKLGEPIFLYLRLTDPMGRADADRV